MRALASSLLANAETRTSTAGREADQLGSTATALGLTGTEQKLLPGLGTGQGLWRIKNCSFSTNSTRRVRRLDTTSRMIAETGKFTVENDELVGLADGSRRGRCGVMARPRYKRTIMPASVHRDEVRGCAGRSPARGHHDHRRRTHDGHRRRRAVRAGAVRASVATRGLRRRPRPAHRTALLAGAGRGGAKRTEARSPTSSLRPDAAAPNQTRPRT